MENMNSAAKESILPEEQAALAAQRGEIYGFFATVFNALPDNQLAENLQNMKEGDLMSLFAVEGEQELPPEMIEGLQLLEKYALSSRAKAPEDIKNEIAADRVCLMKGVKYDYGIKPPLESLYTESEDSFKTLTDVRDCYREAGLDITRDAKERPDYMGIELDFMTWLAEQEASAWLELDEKPALSLREKQQYFLTNHLVLWVPNYCKSMFEGAQTDFYRGIARLLAAFILQEALQEAEKQEDQ